MKLRTLVRAPALTSSGYGVHSQQIIFALLNDPESYDVHLESVPWGVCPAITEDNAKTRALKQLSAKYQHAKAQGHDKEWDLFISITVPQEFQRRGHLNIGITAGIETDRVSSQWLQACNQMDLIVVPSQHAKSGFVNSSYNWQNQQTGEQGVLRLERPIVVLPEGFDAQSIKPRDSIKTQAIKDLQFASAFNFLCVGLWGPGGYGEDRKNIANTILYFFKAFQGRKDVGLVLKVSIAKNSTMDYDATVKRIEQIKANFPAGSTPPVYLVHGALTEEEMGELYCHPQINALLSLTQGEGFGLPILEAAASSLPIIATNWSGHLDFLRKGNSADKLFSAVSYALQPIPDAAVWEPLLIKGAQWAVPSEEDAIKRMQQAVERQSLPREWARQLQSHVNAHYNLAHVQRQTLQLFGEFVKANALQTGKPEAIKDWLVGHVDDPEAYNILYTMPMSTGDVFLSTAVIDTIVQEASKENNKVHLYFATGEQFAPVLMDNANVHKIIPWNEALLNISMMEEVFDRVYTPNIPTQFVFSNWVRGGTGRQLLEEFANHCQVKIGKFFIAEDESVFSHILADNNGLDLRRQAFATIHAGSGKGTQEARNYLEWQEVISNLKAAAPDLILVQVGGADEPAYKDIDVDMRGKTSPQQLASILKLSKLHLSIDTFSMHLAAAFNVPLVSIFGSSHANSTGPYYKKREKSKFILLEAENKMGCKQACYKNQCKVNREMPCVNEISSAEIVHHAKTLLKDVTRLEEHKHKHTFPTISGYTTSYNAIDMGYPFIESISSMLGFCDEVVIVDHSTDGTYEILEKMAQDDERIVLYQREWDTKNPGEDGDAKAFARALCSMDYCWQQDLDEVVHEKHYEAIRWITKRFPTQADILHLPVIELWGDEKHVTGRRHCWKWRLSRNLPHITHGINKYARLTDEKTGVVYAKEDMSDGCEYVDAVTYEPLKHVGFYTAELDQIRINDHAQYAEICNTIFDKIPCVYHTSWMSIDNKIAQFKKNWNQQWDVLYQRKASERFPGVNTPKEIDALVEHLREQGGEDSDPVKYAFELEHSMPAVMKDWFAETKELKSA